MASAANHYEVLGVPPDATPATIKEAYFRLVRANHPDRIAKKRIELESKKVDPEMIEELLAEKERESNEKTQELNAAYSVLSDPDLRRDYDFDLGLNKASAGHSTASAATGSRGSSTTGSSKRSSSKTSSGGSKPPLKPNLSIYPATIDLGTLTPGSTKIVSFTITNVGGPVAGNLTINDWKSISWISNQEAKPDPLQIFPILVSFKVNTSGLKHGQYNQVISATVDGSEATFTFTFRVQTPPALVVKPSSLDLGKLYENTKKRLSFSIENQGGPTQGKIVMKGFHGKPWFVDRSIKANIAGQDFPKTLEFSLDTTQLELGEYADDFQIGIDGQFINVKLSFDVVAKPKTRLIITPNPINVYGVPIDSQRTVSFTVDYDGILPKGNLRVSGTKAQPWFRKPTIKPKYEGQAYPLIVTFTIDTVGMLPAQVTENVIVQADDVSAILKLSIQVTDAPAARNTAAAASRIWWDNPFGYTGLAGLIFIPTALLVTFDIQSKKYAIANTISDFDGFAGNLVVGGLLVLMIFVLAKIKNLQGLSFIMTTITNAIAVLGVYGLVVGQMPAGTDRFLVWSVVSLSICLSLSTFIGQISGNLARTTRIYTVFHTLALLLFLVANLVILTSGTPDALKVGLISSTVFAYFLGPFTVH
jgi:hypothetical protein